MTTPTRKRPKAKAKLLSASPKRVAPATGERALRRDLEVHREELASQNEELRRANAALVITKERFAQLYDGAPMAYFTLDEGGTVVEANLAGSVLLEASRNLIFGRSFDEIVVPSSRQSFRNFRNHVLEGRGRFIHETMLMLGGKRFHVRIEAACLASPSGGAGQCLLCVSDETERRHLEDERRVLEGRKADADRIDSLARLASSIAHEFDDILEVARENADLILPDTTQPASSIAAVVKIREAVIRASHLARQMLAYTGRQHFEPEPLDVSRVVRSMSRLLTSSTPKDVSLEVTLADDLPLIAGEDRLIQQIVLNLVLNAADAIAPGAGKITIQTRHEASGENVVIEVTDDGRGMDEATRHRVFDPFFSTKLSGRGLGLAVVHGNVRAHGGTVEVAAALPGGTTFCVRLPVVPIPRLKAARRLHANDD